MAVLVCDLCTSGSVDIGHPTAIMGSLPEVTYHVGGSGVWAGRSDSGRCHYELQSGPCPSDMSHDWLSVHPCAEASEARNSAVR